MSKLKITAETKLVNSYVPAWHSG